VRVHFGNNEDHFRSINSGTAIPSTVDVLKAVVYWYDDRHDGSLSALGYPAGTKDNLNLYLVDDTGTTIASSTTSDNKERIIAYGSSIQGKILRLKVRGANVSNDFSSCGTNKAKFTWAYFFEDSARDDVDGPTLDDAELE
jgi:hypothetical protein